MKPGRSPRFQSDALRRSSAAMSACGSPAGEGGAAQAASITAHHTPRTAHLRAFGASERSAGASRGDGPNHPKDAPAECRRRLLAATPSRRLPPFRFAAALRLGARPLLRGPLLRLGSRRLPLGSWLAPRRRHRLVPHRRWGGGRRRGGALSQGVTEVQVAPPSVTIKVGERNGLLATAFDRVGNVIPTARVIWSSNNVAVAKVDNNGTVTGIGGGVAIIEARVGARKGTAAVQVVGSPPAAAAANPTTQPAAPAHPTGEPAGAPGPDPLAGQLAGTGPAAVLRIEPPTIYLLPSENTRAAPRALKDDGTPAAPVPVTWKSLRPDIASVDQNGVIVALAPGQGTVQVTSAGGLTATAPVVVQQAEIAVQEPVPLVMSPGDVDTLHVAVPSQGGRLVSPLALQWSTADATVARVNLTGIVTPVAPGRTTLTVAGLLQTKTVEVVVHRTVEQLAVSPSYKADVPLPIQGTVKFTVQGLAADRTPVPEAQFRWIVGDTTLAGFDPASGTLTGKRAGKTTLTVKGPGPGLSVTWPIRVIAAGLKLSASRLGVSLARHVPLRASFADESGGVIGPATGVSWASDNPSVATVAEDGTVATTGYGHARVTATAPGGRRAVAEVFVQGEIVVASSRSGRLQLYAAERANLAQLRKVMDDTATATEPAFSPDGSRIAFTSTRDGQPEVYVMDADGTNAQRLTNSPGLDGDPSFSADGQAGVFQ